MDDLVLRCGVTGNECRTDTRPIGKPCTCPMCRADAELTRFRERNAELEAWKAKLHSQVDDFAERYIQESHKLKAANLRITSLEATARELREALEKFMAARLRNERGEPAGWRISGKDSINEAEQFALGRPLSLRERRREERRRRK